MEDSHITSLDIEPGISFFGVYDGHGGKHLTILKSLSIIGSEMAWFVREHLVDELKKLESFRQREYEQCLKDIYLKMDDMIKTQYGKKKL